MFKLTIDISLFLVYAEHSKLNANIRHKSLYIIIIIIIVSLLIGN